MTIIDRLTDALWPVRRWIIHHYAKKEYARYTEWINHYHEKAITERDRERNPRKYATDMEIYNAEMNCYEMRSIAPYSWFDCVSEKTLKLANFDKHEVMRHAEMQKIYDKIDEADDAIMYILPEEKRKIIDEANLYSLTNRRDIEIIVSDSVDTGHIIKKEHVMKFAQALNSIES